ncbi:hypothetical protein OROMI_031220 [Orobanche minor]
MVSFTSGGLSGEVSNKRPLENGYMPKYKPRRVSAIRDFPPGCGRNAVPINLKSEENGGTEAGAMVAKTVGSSQMAVLIEPEAVENSKITIKTESNEVNTAEMPKKDNEIKDSEIPNVVGHSDVIGIKNSNFMVGCELGEAVNIAVDVDMTDSLDALVGNIMATANVDEKLLVETGLGTQLPNEVEYHSHEGMNNPIEVEMAESLDVLVGKVATSTNEGISNDVEVDTLNDVKSDSSGKQAGAGGPEILKELNEVVQLALVKNSDMGAKSQLGAAASVDNEALSLLQGSSKAEATIWPKDKYRMRSVSAVRDFPPNCGRNVPLPTEEEKQMVIAGNGCPDGIEKVEVTPTEILSKNMSDGGMTGDMPPTTLKEYLGGPDNIHVRNESTAFNGDDSGRGPSREMIVYSAAKNDKGRPPPCGLDLVNEYCMDVIVTEEDCGAYDENMPEITPISTIRAVPDTSDIDSAEPARKDMVVYSRGKRVGSADKDRRKVVHGLMAAPNCPWRNGKAVSTNPGAKLSGEKSRNQNYLWRQKANVVAKKSSFKVKSSRMSSKKLKKAHIRDPDESPGALVTEYDDEGHSGDFTTESPPDYKSQDVEVTLPPFGPKNSGHGDARDRVRNTLRLFNAICRKLLQKEENSAPGDEGKPKKKIKRIDLFAANIIKEKGKEVNTGKPILGEVPGVVVGDEFQYRVELAVVGIHRLYQAGIDSMKLNNGLLVASSIVSSGAYADDLENNDVLIYSGQGGNIVGKKKQQQQPEDQKLERGNLALKNCISAKTPVRVIRGWKDKAVDPLDPKQKFVTTYVYDGLYTVTKYWRETGPHGKQVFMFELRRNPGQPELAWKELKKSTKSRFRPGVCVPDISLGKEPFAICAVNTVNDEKPPMFNYISKMMYPDWHNPIAPSGCHCTGRCSDSKKCLCAMRNGGEIPYNHNGALVETKLLLYECGPHCKCPPSCYNRVSQRGIRYQLEIFKTESRGWGVRARTSIPSGSFICEYAGELLEDTEAEQKIGSDEYLFDIGKNLSHSSTNPEDKAISAELVEDGGYTIDACQYGNLGRFVNHSCSPNLYAQNVIYDHDDMRMPHIMLFAMENIPPLQELTYDYNYSVDQIRDSRGNIKVKKCYCGTADCTGRLY